MQFPKTSVTHHLLAPRVSGTGVAPALHVRASAMLLGLI